MLCKLEKKRGERERREKERERERKRERRKSGHKSEKLNKIKRLLLKTQ